MTAKLAFLYDENIQTGQGFELRTQARPPIERFCRKFTARPEHDDILIVAVMIW